MKRLTVRRQRGRCRSCGSLLGQPGIVARRWRDGGRRADRRRQPSPAQTKHGGYGKHGMRFFHVTFSGGATAFVDRRDHRNPTMPGDCGEAIAIQAQRLRNQWRLEPSGDSQACLNLI